MGSCSASGPSMARPGPCDAWTAGARRVWISSGFASALNGAPGPGRGDGGPRLGRASAGMGVRREIVELREGATSPAPADTLPVLAREAGICCGLAVPLKCDDDVLAIITVLGRTWRPPGSRRDRPPGLDQRARGAGGAAPSRRTAVRARSEGAGGGARAARGGDAMRAGLHLHHRTRRQHPLSSTKSGRTCRPPARSSGEPWRRYAWPGTEDRVAAALEQVFTTGAHQFYEIALEQPNGRAIWMSNHVGPVRMGGEIVAAVVLSQDVTEAEDRAARARGRAAHWPRWARWRPGVAHEINTPVQFVSDSVHFLREAANDVVRAGRQACRGCKRWSRAARASPSCAAAVAAASEAAERADLELPARERAAGVRARARRAGARGSDRPLDEGVLARRLERDGAGRSQPRDPEHADRRDQRVQVRGRHADRARRHPRRHLLHQRHQPGGAEPGGQRGARHRRRGQGQRPGAG